MTCRFRTAARIGVSDIQMQLGSPTQVLVHGDAAYEAIPGVVVLKGKHGCPPRKGNAHVRAPEEVGSLEDHVARVGRCRSAIAESTSFRVNE